MHQFALHTRRFAAHVPGKHALVGPEWLPARSIAERLLRDGDPASIFDYRQERLR
jgi:hypothetical protein